MCLIKKSFIPRISFKDKTVYKVIIRRGVAYETPFRYSTIKLNTTYKGISQYNRIFESKIKWAFKIIKNEFITDGFIHSVKDLRYIDIFIAESRLNNPYSTIEIVKCTIPKFTLYFIGTNNEIASRKLRYDEIINEW